MLKYIALILALLAPLTAQAQTAPPTGQFYFAGTTAELFKIRAALRLALANEALLHGSEFGPASCWAAPFVAHDDNCFAYNDGPWQADETGDCMAAYYHGPDSPWNRGSALYLGQTLMIDVDPTEGEQFEAVRIPSADELVDPEGLPPACKQRLIVSWCSHWAEDLCEGGELYCCGL